MFKNSVFKVSVNTQKWIKATSIRVVKTMAQTALATIGTSSYLGSVNWTMVASTSVLAGIITVFTSLAGLPEVESEE